MTKTRPDARCQVAADDPLSAALEEIRKHYEVWGDANDVPRLLAALDEVLKPHQPGRVVIQGALCTRHENHRYFSITQREADDVIACEACPATVYTSCDGCGTHIPFESCRTRRRITRALLGDAGEVQP